MKTKLVTIAALLILATLAVAQTVEEPEPATVDTSDDQLLPGEAALRALALAPLQLGADLGNSCICLCRQTADPRIERWGYFERSIVSGCQWSGRICVVDGQLGSIGACTASPAPLG